jgi:hypothetical protein
VGYGWNADILDLHLRISKISTKFLIPDYELEIYSNSLAPQLSTNKQTNKQRKYKLNFGRKGAKAQI